LRKKLVDKDTMYAAISAGGSLWLWDRHESIIKEIRRRYNMPELGVNFEYLIEEHKKMMKQRGHSLEVPEFYGRYIENP
jgi:hypothetical protein